MQACATPDVCSQTHLGAHEHMHIKALRNPSDLIFTLDILCNSKITVMLRKSSGPQTLHLVPFVTYFLLPKTLNGDTSNRNILYKKEKLLPFPTLFLSISLFLLSTGCLEQWPRSSSLSTSPSVRWLRSWLVEPFFCGLSAAEEIDFQVLVQAFYFCGLCMLCPFSEGRTGASCRVHGAPSVLEHISQFP